MPEPNEVLGDPNETKSDIISKTDNNNDGINGDNDEYIILVNGISRKIVGLKRRRNNNKTKWGPKPKKSRWGPNKKIIRNIGNDDRTQAAIFVLKTKLQV